MAATIRTVSKTTASLSDAKNLKTGPRCQEGRTEKMVAMIGDQFPQERGAVQHAVVAQPSWLWGQRASCPLIGLSCLARNEGKISGISSAALSLISLAPGLTRSRSDFFAPLPSAGGPRTRFPRRSCSWPRAYWSSRVRHHFVQAFQRLRIGLV